MMPQAPILQANIKADQREIDKIYSYLAPYADGLTTQEQTITASYYLHNLYSAFKNIALNVAKAFENHIEKDGQWHAALLKRMTLDIKGIRPKLWSEETYETLNELRRFRHIFRNAYTIELDPHRIGLVITQAQQLQISYKIDLEQFIGFLNSLM